MEFQDPFPKPYVFILVFTVFQTQLDYSHPPGLSGRAPTGAHRCHTLPFRALAVLHQGKDKECGATDVTTEARSGQEFHVWLRMHAPLALGA